MDDYERNPLILRGASLKIAKIQEETQPNYYLRLNQDTPRLLFYLSKITPRFRFSYHEIRPFGMRFQSPPHNFPFALHAPVRFYPRWAACLFPYRLCDLRLYTAFSTPHNRVHPRQIRFYPSSEPLRPLFRFRQYRQDHRLNTEPSCFGIK